MALLVFVAARGLSVVVVSGGYSLGAVRRLLFEVASLVVDWHCPLSGLEISSRTGFLFTGLLSSQGPSIQQRRRTGSSGGCESTAVAGCSLLTMLWAFQPHRFFPSLSGSKGEREDLVPLFSLEKKPSIWLHLEQHMWIFLP